MEENAPETSRVPTVLIVDDDTWSRKLLSGWLGEAYRVLEAGDGEAGLALVEAEDPDVVLLDVLMPGMTGIEACRRIKGDPDAPYRPVLLLTALEEQKDRNAGLEAGADDFLSKPIDQRELLLRVRTFTRLRRQETLIREQLAELQRLDRLKEDLVALVSHDLLNALSGLIVLMESIQYAGAACTPEDLTTLLGAASRMRETLEDMLRIKQLEDGVLRPDRAVVSLDDIVSGAIALVEPSARSRGVTVQPRVPPRATAYADAVLLRRSLFNLLQNAVKFSPRGETVEVEARVDAENVEIEVHDRGPGVDAEVEPRLFTKYASVNTTSRRRIVGTGLGLFLVQLVAAAHGGTAGVRARPGGGTTFRITFPTATG